MTAAPALPSIGDVARATTKALEFRGKPTFDQWLDVGRRLGRITDSSCWWIADWAFYGDGTFGRKYEEAIAATGLEYQTLRNYAYVAGRFAVSRRRDNLSFGHHAEVAALDEPDQDAWLDQAAADAWSRNELRQALRDARALGSAPASVSLRLSIEPDREARWRHAAQAHGQELDEWIILVLDRAASR